MKPARMARPIELEHRHNLSGDSGVIRVLLYNNTADMGNYDEALANPVIRYPQYCQYAAIGTQQIWLRIRYGTSAFQ